jgi:cell division protein FtsQ
VKKVKNILFLATMIAYLVMVSGFIGAKEKVQRVSAIKIHIIDSADNQFIKTEDIRSILQSNQFNPIGEVSSALKLGKIEKALKSKQIINRAEVFVTEPGTVHVEISQKTPFVRVFNRYGQGYYLDKKGNIIPLSQGFSPFVIVANGYIAEPFSIGRTINIMDVKHDSLSRSLHTIYDVYKLAQFITGDDFWNAQIEQIYVNSNFEIELIPRVGSHVVELGRVENLEEKFENLKILYSRGFNNLGWNQYEKISLKYKNQVVCTKIQ